MATYIKNRRARFEYFIEKTFRAGISLTGSEVKSLRDCRANITEAFCVFDGGELYLKNAHITAINNIMFTHEENRDRKLLLTKKELKELDKKVKIKGYAIVPLEIEIPDTGYVKVHIGLCKGKHNYDKKQTIKERDIDREHGL